MKKTDLAYAAGIIDGEGCIGIWRKLQQQRYLSYDMRVSVGMIDQWLPNWLHFAFGGSITFHKSKQENCNPQWQWRVVSNQALEFLILILPYLKIKKPQAELAIAFQQAPYRAANKTDANKALDEAQAILMHSMKSPKGKVL